MYVPRPVARGAVVGTYPTQVTRVAFEQIPLTASNSEMYIGEIILNMAADLTLVHIISNTCVGMDSKRLVIEAWSVILQNRN